LNYLYFTKVDPSSEYTLEIILPMDAGNCDLGAYREWFTKLKDTQQLSGEEQQAEKERITQMIQDQGWRTDAAIIRAVHMGGLGGARKI
jgi:hypothetical protein